MNDLLAVSSTNLTYDLNQRLERLKSSWRHRPSWVYSLALISSLIALVVSFILAAETLYLARHPNALLSCDVNMKVSCSTVAQSWQSEIVHLGHLAIPNAFLGIAAESVFVTIAVIGLIIRMPRWFTLCTWIGSLCAFMYAYWLLYQSAFVIQALCPWCLLLMFSTTLQFMSFTHATVTVSGWGLRHSWMYTYYRLHLDLMFDLLWVGLIIAGLAVLYLPYLL